MVGDAGSAWQRRHDAAAAEDRARDAERAERSLGVPLGHFLVRQVPGTAALFLLGLFLQSWLWGAAMAAFSLPGALVIRAWARRHYGITTRRPPD